MLAEVVRHQESTMPDPDPRSRAVGVVTVASMSPDMISSPEANVGHAFAEAPDFSDQLRAAERGERTAPATYRSSRVTPEGEWEMGELRPTTEGEMLTSLDAFLSAGEIAARKRGDEETADRAPSSRANTTFLGREELNTGLDLLAEREWSAYLQADPANRIVFFAPAASRGPRSMDFIGHAIADRVRARHPELADRVQVYDSLDDSVFSGLDATHARIELPDDWVSGGGMITGDAKQIAVALRQIGRDDLIPTMQACLVVARDDQLANGLQFTADGPNRTRQTLPVVAAYRSAAGPRDMTAWGTHSSVDHNDSYLRLLAQYQAEVTGQAVDLPQASLLQRPYR
ncbi:MAG TPA: hypothetical protein VLH84_01190 [Patescibacteria group bacterium]|nr:hypothetical protein [Patescibacteria group bacterium]